MTKLYEDVSKKNSGIEYHRTFLNANDSIKTWVNKGLKQYAYEKNNDWKIDSLVCFNTKANKCVMALMVRDTLFKPSNSDGITFFYGVKIKDRWYFFKGAFIVLPRDMFDNKNNVPLSFEKLHEIAMKEVFSGYLIKDTWGNWIINDKFFNRFDEMFKDTREFEEKYHNKKFSSNEEFMDWYVKTLVEVNWSTKDTTIQNRNDNK